MTSPTREAYYGLPHDVKFCSRCTMSNQKPNSTPEHKHTSKSKKDTMKFNEENVCSACIVAENKDQHTDWKKREEDFLRLLDKHRKTDGSYDCIVPGSGGKDSAFQAHILKYKYGMNPLTITWPPIMYTEYGLENFRNWIEVGGFDNLSYYRNGKVLKTLTRLGIENLCHPFQTFILGQMNLAPRIAKNFGVNLIFYGENPSEYGNNIKTDFTPYKCPSYFAVEDYNDLYLAGVSVKELRERYDLSLNDLLPYLPPKKADIDASDIKVAYLGYFHKWVPQEAYYYAIEHTGFKARPYRSQGTYSKYASIDDKMDDLHWYTTHIKFGIGRTTYDSSQEIRNRHLTREEGVALVEKFDGEFPDIYFQEVLDWLDMSEDEFTHITDKFRSPHLWAKNSKGDWQLRHTVGGNGLDD